ncbi:MAG: sulfite exporter TauE/SafE family protein [Thermomicrobiales bacterium]|nr:sulfite exporter TauE/SafE family protein [Thermomicrobiales bacterium]
MTIELIAAWGIVFGGGIVTGLAGFGFALAIVPPLLLFYSAPTVTAVAISLTLVTGWIVLLGTWRLIEVSTVSTVLPGAIVGLGAGVLLLRSVDEAWIKLLAGVVVLVFTVATFRGLSIPGSESRGAPPLAGFLSGVLNISTGMASPPVALLFASRRYQPNAFRSSIVAYFYVIDLLAMMVLIQQGLVGWSELRTVALLLPAALAGTVVGRHLLTKASEAQFWRLVMIILLGTGLVGVTGAIWDLR